MNLSKHFSLEEMVFSQTAARSNGRIDNTPDAEALANLRGLANFLEVVREKVKRPIHITSGYRSHQLNQAVGGTTNPPSAHTEGRAADIISPSFGTPAELAELIVALDLEFDQIILEFSDWVHVSVSDNPRHQILTALSTPDGTHYEPGIKV